MNKGYAAGNVERTAKEILASMQVVCPEKVWQDLSFELEQTKGTSDSKWKNKLSTPQTLLLAIVLLTGSTIFLWKYLAGKNNVPTATYKAPAPSQIVKPAPQPVQSKPIVTTVVKDTATPVATNQANSASTQNTPVVASNTLPPVAQNVNKRQGLNSRMPKPNTLVKKDSTASSGTIEQNAAPAPHPADTKTDADAINPGISNVIQAVAHDSIN